MHRDGCADPVVQTLFQRRRMAKGEAIFSARISPGNSMHGRPRSQGGAHGLCCPAQGRSGGHLRPSPAGRCLHRQRVVVCRRLKISDISAGKVVSFLSHCRKFVFAGEKRPRNRQNKIRPLARVCRPKQITPSSTAAAGKFAFCRANFSFSCDVRRLLQLRLNCNGRVGARRRTKSQHGPAQRTCF